MSRRRSSGPPWTAPQPPDLDHPWSLCPGTHVWTRHSLGKPSWLPESSGSESKRQAEGFISCDTSEENLHYIKCPPESTIRPHMTFSAQSSVVI